MKKLLAMLLSLLFVFTAFVACEKDDDEKDDGKDSYVSVSKEEWKKAFELDGITSYTVDIKETYSGEGEASGTVKINGDNFYGFMEWYGEERETIYGKVEDYCDEEAIPLFSSTSYITEIADETNYLLEEYLDCAYAKFDYSEKNGYYKFTYEDSEYDETYVIKVYFGKDKLVSKVVMELTYGESEEVDSGELVFSNYNSTEKVSLPTSEMQSLLNDFPPLTDSPDYMSVWEKDQKMSYDDEKEIISAINAVISELNISDAVGFYKSEEGRNDISFDIAFETSKKTLVLEDLEFEYTTLEISFGAKFDFVAKNANGESVCVYLEYLQ